MTAGTRHAESLRLITPDVDEIDSEDSTAHRGGRTSLAHTGAVDISLGWFGCSWPSTAELVHQTHKMAYSGSIRRNVTFTSALAGLSTRLVKASQCHDKCFRD
jgi:hypothetical protein